MKLRRLPALVVVALATLAALPTLAMDVDELLGKVLDAQGGVAPLQAIQSQKMTGKFITQGLEIPYTMQQLRPNRMRIDAAVMGMSIVQCFDGAAGWSVNPMSGSQDAQPMGEIETKSFRLQADMDGPFLGWQARGWTAEYVGQEDMEGTPTHRLRLDTKQDLVMDYWFDAETYLTLKQNTKIKIDQNEVESQTYFSDYRQQGGLTIPFMMEQRQGDQVMTQITVETVEIGAAVDPSIFAMPPKAPAPAPADSTGN